MPNLNMLKSEKGLSFKRLTVFAAIFAIIGIYTIWHSSAASSIGDLNSDGVVNITDLSILLSNYSTTNSVADLNSDGQVNIIDLSTLLSNYGTSVSATSIHQTLGFNTLNTAASDEFTSTAGSKPDSTRWGAKTFSASNGSVVFWNGLNNVQLDGAGNLDISAIRDSDGIHWTSSWISGNNSYSGTHFIEARAKVATGSGPWSGPVWEWDAPYGSVGIENDINEQLGIEPQAYHTTLHSVDTQIGKTNNTSSVLGSGYHIYAAAIYADHVDYYLDGVNIQTITKAELGGKWGFVETPMVLNIDLDMGGWGGTPNASLPSTVHLLVDYIRVYTP
jgi:hypothetical protein